MQKKRLIIPLALSLLTGCITTQPTFNNFNEFSIFKNPDNSDKTLSIEYDDMQYESILNNTFGAFGIEAVYQERMPITTTYKLTAINKPINRILQATLQAQCLNYRKLRDDTVLIFKDPSQTHCTPLPAGAEIRVN